VQTQPPTAEPLQASKRSGGGLDRVCRDQMVRDPKKLGKHHTLDKIPKERMTAQIERRFVHGERAMVAQVFLKKGAVVQTHTHESEQITYILEGALRLWLGAHGEQEVTVNAGEILTIPSNVPHRAEALEDTLDVDVFSPPRQDWIDKTDDYLRR
jgi:quercetin dioxygenase-like cupin family protein